MKRLKKTVKVSFLAALAAMTFCLDGCYFGEHFLVGEPIDEAALIGLRQRVTTKEDILVSFGPPDAIARRGTVMTFPPPGPEKSGWQDVQSEVFFEMFPSGSKASEGIVIYYYHADQVSNNGVSFLLVGGHTKRTKTDELWVFINERTGLVEDFVLRRKGKSAAPCAALSSPYPTGGNR